MEKQRIISIFTNEDPRSLKIGCILKQKLEKSGFHTPNQYDPDSELLVCVGGDGSFLKALHRYDFPDIPFVGVNTGHLGFFQELHTDQLDEFIFKYKQGRYVIQELRTIRGHVEVAGTTHLLQALNEIVIKGAHSLPVHLNLSIGDSFIERFSGDGILIATSAGSTAYNYSLGGSIVDPRLKLLQVTPISPMNTTAYRSFTSSVILPYDLQVNVYPEDFKGRDILLVTDGIEHHYGNIDQLKVEVAEKTVKLLRFENYDFWGKVKSKFL